MASFIKNIGLILCCIYYYIKLLHISVYRNSIFSFFLSAILTALLCTLLDFNCPILTMPFSILFIAVILPFQTKTQLSVSFSATSISFALSYVMFTFSAMIVSGVALLFYRNDLQIFFQFLCCTLQLLIAPVPFRLNRLKKGMPFLYKRFYTIPGIIISIAILCIAIILNSYTTYNILYIITPVLLLTFSILIYLYWKINITKTYIDKLSVKNIEDLNCTLLKKIQYIEELEQENKRLSKIIHKDNKLIPAMEYAVQNYIHSAVFSSPESIHTGDQLLEELAKLSQDHKGILLHQTLQCQKMDSTKVIGIDNLLSYMQQKAIESGIVFNISISCDIQYLIENIINEDTLNTLLADLLENAIIATGYNNGHYIFLSIGKVSNAYCINIFDSGIPFSREVLAKWGIEQITTHQDDAGSGIGLITTYEIIKKHNASFLINELISENGVYTKEVSVLFNKLNQYILHTSRNEEELTYLNQRADLLIIRK